MDRHYRPAAREVLVGTPAGLAGWESIGAVIKAVADVALSAVQIGFAVDAASKAEGLKRASMEAEKTRAAQAEETSRIQAQADKTRAETLAKLTGSAGGATAGLPSWVLPAGIGGILLLVGGGYFLLRKK